MSLETPLHKVQGMGTVNIVSTKRLPLALWVPKETFRQITA